MKPINTAFIDTIILKKCENNLPLAVTNINFKANARSSNNVSRFLSVPFCNHSVNLHLCDWPTKLILATSNSLGNNNNNS